MVDIYLYHDGEWTMLVDNWYNTGVRTVVVPPIPSDRCLIRVYDAGDYSKFDDSDAFFSISYEGGPGSWELLWYDCMNINPLYLDPNYHFTDLDYRGGIDEWDSPYWQLFDNYVAWCSGRHDGQPNPNGYYHDYQYSVMEFLPPISTGIYSKIKFQFWVCADIPNWDSGDYLVPSYHDGLQWHELDAIYGPNPRPPTPQWVQMEYNNLPPMDSFRYRFDFISNQGNYNPYNGYNYFSSYQGVYVDEVKVYGLYSQEDSLAGGITPKKINTDSDLPTEFSLSQNAPNPFNPITDIRFALPEDCHVKLTIYDILGRKVATLLDRWLNAGYHNSSVNGSTLTSGIYIYRMEAKDYISVKKMILMK